ncbi:MAG TPA: tRNA epoxyqueuosine(34) reductase QueG [Candidatus Polarisedimenticolaceae bacterium]|nr:tRNA epoxyqueuosine(34) reductase QueG [Candidatus Polarisedimenticolaceae bacterium]
MGGASAARLTRELELRARREGFDRVAVARAERLDRDARALEDWLNRGRHAAMTWMARDPTQRADPTHLLDRCRSVVALAIGYYPGEDEAAPAVGQGRVASYARGRDYHKVLRPKLRRLTSWLIDETGGRARGFVDTAPVLERGWAERAGLGWIGKNSCLLTRDAGSYLLLAEILTTAELEPTGGPHLDHCGSCTACIDACPTDAIVAPGVVDSNACISYWTIEHRGSVPEARRAGNADWIFGCDLCQEVCPWNHKSARAVDAARLGRRDDLRALDPLEILELTEERFRARYSGTALMRAKWEGMRRNACIVLGNHGDETAIDGLTRALDDPDPVIRSHAGWALARIAERRPARGSATGDLDAERDESERSVTRPIKPER